MRFCERHGVPYVGGAENYWWLRTKKRDRGSSRTLRATRYCERRRFFGDGRRRVRSAKKSLTCAPRLLSGRHPIQASSKPEALIGALGRLCRDLDVAMLVGTTVIDAKRTTNGGVELVTPHERFRAHTVVNAAGLYADDVSAMLGGKSFRIKPCRGEYAELASSKREWVKGLGLPTPARRRSGLGVHLTRTTWGKRAHRADGEISGFEGRLRGRTPSARGISGTDPSPTTGDNAR